MSDDSKRGGADASAASCKEEARRFFQEGVSLLKQKKPEEALERLRQAVRLRPVFPDAYKALSLVFKAQGDTRRARRALLHAAEALVLEERFEEGRGLMRELCQVAPDLPDPFATAAATLEARQRHQRAIRVLEQALEHAPDDPSLHLALARNLAAAGHKEKALATLTAAKTLLRDSAEAQALLRQLGGPGARVGSTTEVPAAVQDDEDLTIEVFQPRERATPAQDREDKGKAQEPVSNVRSDVQSSADKSDRRAGDASRGKKTAPKVEEDVEEKEGVQPSRTVEHRRSERIPVADYFVRFSRFKPPHSVVNLSTGGLAFKVGKAHLATGDKVCFDLMALGEVKIRKLRVEIRHISAGVAGGCFIQLSERQKNAIETVIRKTQEPGYCEAAADITVDFNLDMW